MKNVTYINAGAGSGKTYKLTHILADLVKNGEVSAEQVILTTFTEKAANEFKEKAKAVLYEDGSKEAIKQAVMIDHALVNTIHGVAYQLVNKFWFLLGLHPNMGIMAEEDVKFYTTQSLSDVPTVKELDLLHQFSETFDITHSFGSGQFGTNYDFWQEDLKQIIGFSTNYEIKDYAESRRRSKAFFLQFVDESVSLEYSKEELTAVFNAQQRFYEEKGDDGRLHNLKLLRTDIHRPTIGWLKRVGKLFNELKACAPEVEDIREQLNKIWNSRKVCDLICNYIDIVFDMAERWSEQFRKYKKQRGLLDFNDIESYLLQLIDTKEAQEEIRQSYKYLFVDEYQDCSPIQVKIFDHLSNFMRHSYWVGDYKQSIFGFRGSDVQMVKAVVDRIEQKQDGNDTDLLPKSYRSLPDIVNVCNKVFRTTFENTLDEKNIVLKEERKNETNITSLGYWDVREDKSYGLIASQIANLVVNKGVEPKDIAVLARKGSELNNVAIMLDKLHIPVNYKAFAITDSKAVTLLDALLQIVVSPRDTLAKATVAYLTVKDFTVDKMIESRILWNADKEHYQSDYLNDVPLVNAILNMREQLRQQSVSAMVETIIIELSLYDIAKQWQDVAWNHVCLDTLITAAKTYEQHCVQMGQPATPTGFSTYINENDVTVPGNPEGVQITTYHSSKGLEWKYVIMLSLGDHPDEEKTIIKRNAFGTHFRYVSTPSAENPYPEVFIQVAPFVYGSGNTNTPAAIQEKIASSALYKTLRKNVLEECNRLLYVGMTRARDVLTLVIEKSPKSRSSLQWFKDMGLNSVATYFGQDDNDLLGVGVPFANTYNPEAVNVIGKKKQMQHAHSIIVIEQEKKSRNPRYVAPSMLHAMGDVFSHDIIGERVPVSNNASLNYAEVGNCVHQIFAGIEGAEDKIVHTQQVVDAYGFHDVLPSADSIVASWNNLTAWLAAHYGSAENIYHERSFQHLEYGRIVSGSMDLVWKTKEGCILVDFKTNPMPIDKLLDPESEHYVGLYAGQLDAYSDALLAAGEKVKAQYIYYPMSGLIVEIGAGVGPRDVIKVNMSVFAYELEDSATQQQILNGAFGKRKDIAIFPQEADDEELSCNIYSVVGKGSQGIKISVLKNGVVSVSIPMLASKDDVALGYAILRSAKVYAKNGSIYQNDEKEKADLSEDAELETYYYRLDNMSAFIENQDQHLMFQGVANEFHLQSDYYKHKTEGSSAVEWTKQAMTDFVTLQWEYQDYEYIPRTIFSKPDEEDEHIGRILYNQKGFSRICDTIILNSLYDNDIKIVNVEDFFVAVKNNMYVKRLDYCQFVVDPMPENIWFDLYDKVVGEVLHHPNTYLLRWNPTISSFTLDEYREAVAKCDEEHGFAMNWSVYEYEKARKGDSYYMLRTGDDHAGLVFRGEFLSNPFESDDWASSSKKRHYVDMSCFEPSAADDDARVSIEQLEAQIPEIDWRRGHSGQLLTVGQAEKLDELWEKLK